MRLTLKLFAKTKVLHEPTVNSKRDERINVPTYNSRLIADVVVAKNQKLIEDLNSQDFITLNQVLLRPLIMFALMQKKEIKVLDLGGGGGTHFHVTRNFLDHQVKLKWAVVETEAMVSSAKVISHPQLEFFTDLNKAVKYLGGVDFALASSVLQYFPDPFDGLNKLLNAKAQYVLITRTALLDDDKIIHHLQKSKLSDNGPGKMPSQFKDMEVEYPVTFVSRKKFILTLQNYYEVICEFEEDQAVHKVNNQIINQYGFLCRRK